MSARRLVAVMALSASAFVALMVSEGYTGKAIIPVTGDRATVGFGSTFHENSAPVLVTDTTTPVMALQKAYAHIGKQEAAFHASLPGVSLTQAEYDLHMDFVYQYGMTAWSKSSMRRELLAGEHRKACDALLLYRRAGGYDCSTPNNTRCAGVWSRQLVRHAKCVAAQSASVQ